MKNLLKNPITAFFIKAFLLYILWYVVYDLWINVSTNADLHIIDLLIVQSGFLVEAIGYDLIDMPYDASYRTLGLDGSHGVWIGDSCDGLTVMALFAGFIIAYPGKLIHKLLYIPIGILLIHLINVLRITALAIIALEAEEVLDFNHTYTFTAIVYAFIFYLWFFYTKYIAKDVNLNNE